MTDQLSYLDTLVEPSIPETYMRRYEVLKEYIVLNIMNQDSHGYIQSPLYSNLIRTMSSGIMGDFQEDIMKITMRLVNDGKVVMNRSTDVSWYMQQLHKENKHDKKAYLLLFDIVYDISDEVRVLEKMLYQRILDSVSRDESTTGEPWEVL